jgi:signal transduction histidine kinase
MFRRSALEMRVVVLAPLGRDAALLAETLAATQIESAVARDPAALLGLLNEGAGLAIIAEEALTPPAMKGLTAWLESQPPWSDMPLIVLTTSGRPTREDHVRAQELQTLGNVTLMERPVRPDTVQSSARAGLRARMRQYEIRSRQEALVQANADLEQFAHSASHDLREPLRSIAIYSELLARSYESVLDQRGCEFLALIQSRARRMDTLLDDLLSYAHASSIAEQPLEPVPASRPLQAAIENLSAAIQESNAQISIAEMPCVRVHESHLAQIFQNLIGNAIKYRKETDRLQIEIAARLVEHQWVFSVADNGIGIPADYKQAIFGIFKRLHSGTQYPGNGMGLAICKRIVERYRGRIWVESEPGSGSSFFFSLPN